MQSADMEILVEIDKKKWPELRDLYRNNWPKNAVAYCILDTHISYPKLSKIFNFKVYCPHGDLLNGMVAIIEQDDYIIMIHPVDDIKKLEEALATTRLIKWNKQFIVPSASSEVEDCMKRIEPIGKRVKGEKALKHILSRDNPKFENLTLPPNTYIGPLKTEHIKFIDKKWTYTHETTYKFFEVLMNNDLTYALYSTDDCLLAWVVIDTSGSLTHLYCVDGHRRKGYAEFLLKYVINEQLSKGKDTLAYTLENNLKANRLFDKLKFEQNECVKWLILY
ncbi:uncharacterized protein LOC113398095 [Vanessa tameamea]|uniref:Glycine N-acyltransferase-like protein n=1 Tax=Vanessa tameamea TaxID=334116 RepID=A0A8B8I5U2_VANTA